MSDRTPPTPPTPPIPPSSPLSPTPPDPDSGPPAKPWTPPPSYDIDLITAWDILGATSSTPFTQATLMAIGDLLPSEQAEFVVVQLAARLGPFWAKMPTQRRVMNTLADEIIRHFRGLLGAKLTPDALAVLVRWQSYPEELEISMARRCSHRLN